MLKEVNLRNLIKIHGGKRYIVKYIIPILPSDYLDREVWDVFGGGGTLLLRTPPAKKEHYNDLDFNLYTMMNCIQKYPQKIIELIKQIKYSKDSFEYWEKKECLSEIDIAIREIVLRRMSRGGIMKSFSHSQRLRGGKMGDENAWITWTNELPKIVSRLSFVKIHNENAIDLIENQANNKTSFLYADPPYYPDTRVSKTIYRYEMSNENHEEFLVAMNKFKGKSIIMGYDCPLYQYHLKNWTKIQIPIANHSSQSKIKKTKLETLWKNY